MAENKKTHSAEKKADLIQTIKNNKPLLIASSFLIIITIVIIIAFAFNKNKDEISKMDAAKNNSALVAKADNLKIEPLKADQKTDAESAVLDFNQHPFDPETEKPSDRFITFQIRQGQKYRMTVKYSNIGDEKMSKGSLTIKLGQGLTLVKNSMKEDIAGKETAVIDDTNLYSSDKNTIQYGPSSLNQTTSVVNPGDAGKITFDVQMSDQVSVGEISRIYSYLSDEGDTKGKIDLVFFNVTPKI